jgi:metal-responsive CopG/Arc/MetJ family transcriptional regulator
MAKVMISIPDDFLAQIDQVTKSRHQSRSEYFRELARRDIERRKTVTDPAEVYRYLREMAERTHRTSWGSMAELLAERGAGARTERPEQVHDRPDDANES